MIAEAKTADDIAKMLANREIDFGAAKDTYKVSSIELRRNVQYVYSAYAPGVWHIGQGDFVRVALNDGEWSRWHQYVAPTMVPVFDHEPIGEEDQFDSEWLRD